MNLELLNPFGRQFPDRIDSTLSLPASLHFRREIKHSSSKKNHTSAADDQEWKSAYHVSFNRRGTYLAAGYGSGTVAVFNILSRSLSALYQSDDLSLSPANFGEGVTSVTWSRRSRTLLSGAAGDKTVTLWDTTHPYGPEESCKGLDYAHENVVVAATAAVDVDTTEKGDAASGISSTAGGTGAGGAGSLPQNTSFLLEDGRYTFSNERRVLSHEIVQMGHKVPPAQQPRSGVGEEEDSLVEDYSSSKTKLVKHPCVSFDFPQPVGGSVQVSPRIPTGGLAALSNGSLVLFWFPNSAFVVSDTAATKNNNDNDNDIDDEDEDDSDDNDNNISERSYYYRAAPKVMIIPVWNDSSHFITCAAFGPHGDRVYAATKDGSLLGFDVSEIWKALLVTSSSTSSSSSSLPIITPRFQIVVGGYSAWHLLVSRNGKYLVVNSSDGALRLYATQDCWETPDKVDKPAWLFQDVVSKVKFAACDLSGDGEYVVGGANGDDNKYELYIWNTTTGALMDKLTGPSVQLYSVAWHPTRSFVAVGASDGFVDVWGPRINWTAFAPDFQALPMNVEYVEREDEFDVDDKGNYVTEMEGQEGTENSESITVDVTTIDKVPVFASDSEDEEEVFNFKTKVVNLLAERGERGRKGKASSVDD